MTSFFCFKACDEEGVSKNRQIWVYVLYGWSLSKVLCMGISLCSPLKFGICDISDTKFNSIQQDYFITVATKIWLCFIQKKYMIYTWKLNFFVFLVNISTANIDKVVSILFFQCWWAYVDSTFLFKQISTLKQHWVISFEST